MTTARRLANKAADDRAKLASMHWLKPDEEIYDGHENQPEVKTCDPTTVLAKTKVPTRVLLAAQRLKGRIA